MESHSEKQTATLAGGCFWCIEAVLAGLRGVARVVSGYTGGGTPDPTYQQVCSGSTGHAEAVQITFDPAVISYEDLLQIFFTLHDPTTLNRQGADVGTQYRSAVFYHTPEQKTAAEKVMAAIKASGIWDGKIVTELAPFTVFYPAEDYHQDYYRNNPGQPYCLAVIAPKIAKLRKQFLDRLKD
jgi:peptide-methionine (S)-S-oxide reductase